MFIYYGLAATVAAAAQEMVAKINVELRFPAPNIRENGVFREDCVLWASSSYSDVMWWKAIKWQHKTQHIKCKRLVLVYVSLQNL